MALKPGQKKDLKIEIKKLKGLKTLERKLNYISNYYSKPLSFMDKRHLTPVLIQELTALKQKVADEVKRLNAELTKTKAEKTVIPPALVKLVKTIAKDCSQVLPEYRKRKQILVRGIINDSMSAFVARSWNNREPKDSSYEAQEIYDMILKKSGFKALRSNSIFTTTDEEFASGYGTIYYIFPKNGFAYTWAKYEKDLVLESASDLLDEDKIEALLAKVTNWYQKTYKVDLNWDFNDSYDVSNDWNYFVKALAKIKYPDAKKVTVDKFVNIMHIKQAIGPTNKDFGKGLASGNEVMISGEYYAVKAYTPVSDYILAQLKLTSQLDGSY